MFADLNNGLTNNQCGYRSAVAWIISVVLVSLVLSLPVTFTTEPSSSKTLMVQLDRRQTSNKLNPEVSPKNTQPQTVSVKTQASDSSIAEMINKTTVAKKPPVAKNQIIKNTEKTLDAPNTVKKPSDPSVIISKTAENPTELLPSSGQIIDEAFNNRKTQGLDKDFLPATKQHENFVFRSIDQPKWSEVTQWIDEDVDKPRVAMNFYSMGIAGSAERFFDKITFTKTFTTKYGTKIHCGLVGLIALCGWK